jgi:hypothetical protein
MPLNQGRSARSGLSPTTFPRLRQVFYRPGANPYSSGITLSTDSPTAHEAQLQPGFDRRSYGNKCKRNRCLGAPLAGGWTTLFPRRVKLLAALCTVVLAGLVGLAAAGPNMTHERKVGWVGAPGPKQPVAFYHGVHIDELKIPCSYCHWTAATSRYANMPPVDVCWGCHRNISITHPEIAKVRGYYLSRRPIPWVRINHQPDYVHFSHSSHVAANVPCATCHGDVGRMTTVYQPVEMNMGWCVECHRANEKKFRPKQAAIDCYTCHY